MDNSSLGKLHYDIEIDSKTLKRQLDQADDDIKRFGNQVSNAWGTAAKGIKVLAAGIATAAVGVTAFGVSAVKAFSESEDVMKQTEAVIKSTGGAAKISAEQVKQLAGSLQNVTRFSDETIQSGQNLLLTFTNIGQDVFPQATETMLDMSQALGQDMKSSAVQLGKALQDPINGVTALRRVGVNFSEDQQEVIKKLVETGKTAEAQALILKELQVEFGGSARAAGETFAGQLDILKNRFGEVQERIGGVILTAINPLAERLSTFVQSDQFQAWVEKATAWIEVNLPRAIDYVTNVIFPALKQILEDLWPVIKTVLSWFADLLIFVKDHTWIIWGIVGAIGAFRLALFLDGAANAFTAVMTTVRAEAILTEGTLAATELGAKGLQGSLLALRGPFIITLGIIGVATVIAAIKQIVDAIDTVMKKWDDMKKQSIRLNNGNIEVNATSDLGLIQQLRNFFGARARGGPVSSGMPYIVGEKGPELMVPDTNGTIVPNDRLRMANGINQTINIYDRNDADYFLRRLNRNQQLEGMGLSPMNI